jgi:hypothetical protein
MTIHETVHVYDTTTVVNSTHTVNTTSTYTATSTIWSIPSGSVQLYESDGLGTVFGMSGGDASQGGTILPSIDMIFLPQVGASYNFVQNWPSVSECEATQNNTFCCNAIGAASCSLFPCVQTYSAAIVNGNLTEKLVSNWTNFNSAGDEGPTYSVANVPCMSASDRKNATDAGYIINSDTVWLPYNNSLTYDGWSSTEGMISNHCIYETSQLAVTDLDYWFPDFFTANMTLEPALNKPQGPSVAEIIYDRLWLYSASFETINTTFANVAAFLTVHIRRGQVGETGNIGTVINGRLPATGTVNRSETCVRVQRGWLAYPIALVLLTFVFFISLLFGVRRQHIGGPGWKSSPLALLYHGLDKEILDQHEDGRLDDINAMVKDAEQLQVQRTRTRKG